MADSRLIKAVRKKAKGEGLTLVRSGGSSGFKHVRYVSMEQKPWKARHVASCGRIHHLGYFDTPEEAALAVARRLGPEESKRAAFLSQSEADLESEPRDAKHEEDPKPLKEAKAVRSNPVAPQTSSEMPAQVSELHVPDVDAIASEGCNKSEKPKKKRRQSGRPAQRRARAEKRALDSKESTTRECVEIKTAADDVAL